MAKASHVTLEDLNPNKKGQFSIKNKLTAFQWRVNEIYASDLAALKKIEVKVDQISNHSANNADIIIVKYQAS